MDLRICAALVHYPVTDKHGHLVSTAITNLDIHDISRAARTYGLQRYYLVTPIEAQHYFARRIMTHWEAGWGADYNPNRKDALQVAVTKTDMAAVADDVESLFGTPPIWVATSARSYPNTISYGALRERVHSGEGPFCLLFGTGWGLHPELIAECDLILEPIVGPTDYNHLSVRSAASIIFDRLLAPR